MTETIGWPRKIRELHNHHMGSTIWNDFEFRDDDVIVATYGKSGTTWVQQILAQMLFGPDPDPEVAEMPPWLDLRIPPKEVKLPEVEAQTRRRILKTHLPLNALVFSPKAKYPLVFSPKAEYLYVGRGGRDVVWSVYNHFRNANSFFYEIINNTPGRVGPPLKHPPDDIHRYWREWFEGDGHPYWSFWENVRRWCEYRGLPNAMFMHFENLKRDMPG